MTKEAAKYQFQSAKGSTLIFPIKNLLHEEKTLVLEPAEGSIPTWHNKEMHLREDCFRNIFMGEEIPQPFAPVPFSRMVKHFLLLQNREAART